MKGMQCVLAACCAIAMTTAANAQSVSAVQRPGIQSGNRFLGFVPQHEKILRQRAVPIDAATAQPTSSTERMTRPPSVRAVPDSRQDIQQLRHEADHGPATQFVHLDPNCACEGPCSGVCKSPSLWGSAEYLYMWSSGVDVPALATTSLPGIDQADAGVLPNASTLFGGEDLHDGMPGGRFSLGMWLDRQSGVGLEASYLFLAEDNESFSATQDDFAILGRPFFNVQLGEEDARLIAFENLVEGSLSINSSSKMDAFELMLRRSLLQYAGGHSELLFGYRRASLDDLIRFDESTTSLDGATIDTQFSLFDQFAAENEFHGGQIGIEYMGPAIRCWSMGLLAKVAIGHNQSRVSITGGTTTTTATGDVSTVTSGLLTQASNIGSDRDDAFSTLSEVGITFNRQWANGFGINIGYMFLHWSKVARAGEQIDRNVNPTQIPPGTLTGAAQPEASFDRGDFWAQGITGGLEYRF